MDMVEIIKEKYERKGVGRPKKTPKKMVAFQTTEEGYEKWKRFAEKQGYKMSELFRIAMIEYYRNHKDDEIL
jgi:hypothetical protein